MFTGIVMDKGQIKCRMPRKRLVEFEIALGSKLARRLKRGDSICVNGVCLTVIEKSGKTINVQVIRETLETTNLGLLKSGMKVNLEPSLLASDSLGGHLLTGHVDGVGKILKIKRSGESLTLQIEAPKAIIQHLVEKGSVAVDGISLTVQELGNRFFKVAIIPYTSGHTTITDKGPGDSVNLEADLVAKYVRKYVRQNGRFVRPSSYRTGPANSVTKTPAKLTEKFLKEQGF